MSIKSDIVDKTTEIQDRNSRKLKVIDELRTYEYNIIVSIEFLINIRKGCDNMVATENITIKVPAGMKKYVADTKCRNGTYSKCTFIISVYSKSDHIAWESCRNFGNKKIRVD